MTISVHGKCILLGEHSVVRGFPALVFPLQSRRLHLSWEKTEGEGFSVSEGEFRPPLTSALELALRLTGGTLPPGHWTLKVRSEIPVQAGLGSSAALAVATVRFLEEAGFSIPDPFSLALEIENIFHGRSSGIDVAAALSERPIRFQKGHRPETLTLKWQPKLYLADSGLRSSTKACVEKVIRLHRPDLDQSMAQAVEKAIHALADPLGFEELAMALNNASEIFSGWGLIPDAVANLRRKLLEAGAIAAKPTGSGDGGYVLSLWKSAPPSALGLTPIWADF